MKLWLIVQQPKGEVLAVTPHHQQHDTHPSYPVMPDGVHMPEGSAAYLVDVLEVRRSVRRIEIEKVGEQ